MKIKNYLLILLQNRDSLSQNENGDRILSVRDHSYNDNDPRTRGPNTNKKLSFHTDRCDVIGFLCLQPAKTGGENQIIQSQRVSDIISKKDQICTKLFVKSFLIKLIQLIPQTLFFSVNNQYFPLQMDILLVHTFVSSLIEQIKIQNVQILTTLRKKHSIF